MKNKKVLFITLGVIVLAVISIVLFFILKKDDNKEDNNILIIYEYKGEADDNISNYYTSEENENGTIVNKYLYPCKGKTCYLLNNNSSAYGYLVVGENDDIYVYNIKTKDKTKLNMTYKKTEYSYQVTYNNKVYERIETFGDVSDNRIWLIDNIDEQLLYDFKENKELKKFKVTEATRYAPIETKNSYFYILEDWAVSVTNYGKIFTKDLKEIIDLDCFYIIDDIIDDDLYIHTSNKNFNDEARKVTYYKISKDGNIETLEEFDSNRDVIALNFTNHSYVSMEAYKAILRDSTGKALKVIGASPKPRNNLGYEYVNYSATFEKNSSGDETVIVRFGCEAGFETNYYTRIYTYNITKDVIETADENKIENQ